VVKATSLREQTSYKPWSSRLGVLREASHLFKEKIHAKKSRQNIAGLINRRVKWNKESKIIIGTWNVRTLLHPGKIQDLAEQISETQLETLAIQEIRWSGTGLTLRRLMSYIYIYGAPILDVSRSHTTTQHSR